MRLEGNNRLRHVLERLRWFALIAVIVLIISIALLILTGLLKLYFIIRGLFETAVYDLDAIDVNILSANLLGIIDIYLLAMVFYIFSVAIYKLFIGDFNTYPWLKLESMDDLKSHIAKITVLFLATFAVQKIVEWQETEKTMYFGGLIVAVCFMLIWFGKSLRRISGDTTCTPEKKTDISSDTFPGNK